MAAIIVRAELVLGSSGAGIVELRQQMNNAPATAYRMIHLKIAVVSLTATIAFVAFVIFA